MRLNLTLSPNTDPVPFNHLHQLTGALHKWLGADNDYHDGISLYSVGWLRGASVRDGQLHFPNGARWRISFHDDAAPKDLLRGILQDPSVQYGMTVTEVQEQTAPAFEPPTRFEVDGPVITRTRREDGSRKYLLFSDEAAAASLTATLRTKLREAGLGDAAPSTSVRFDRSYDGARTKVTEVKGIQHKGSICPVIVEGPVHAVECAWNVGVGELTGCGFGALK